MPLADLFRNEPDIVVYSPGDDIIRTGESADAMYVILEGNVDIRLGDVSIDVMTVMASRIRRFDAAVAAGAAPPP